jgi:molybdate transport system permease protein
VKPRQIAVDQRRNSRHGDFMMFSPPEWEAIRLSLWVAGLATLICLPVGGTLAWLLARRQFWGKAALNSLIHLPLVLPPVVTGYVLLLTFGKRGTIGAFLDQVFGFTFAFRWTGAALAAAVMSLPLMVRAIRLSLEAIDPRLELAGATLGSAPWRVFATITVPLASPGILAGIILTFLKALGEFGATITFVSNIPGETQTLSMYIYGLLQNPGGDAAAARLVLLSIALTFFSILITDVVAARLARRIGTSHA